jgi:hypothetical protein
MMKARTRQSIFLESGDPDGWDVHQEDGKYVAIESTEGENFEVFIDESLFPKILQVIKDLTSEE